MLSAAFNRKSPTSTALASPLGAPNQPSTAAVAVRAKINVHAGANNQSGGCQVGLRSALYQGPVSVSSPPARATRVATAAATRIAQVTPSPSRADAPCP